MRSCATDNVSSCLERLLQLHAERMRALREEEIAANARAALLEELADGLMRGELQFTPIRRESSQLGVGSLSRRVMPHDQGEAAEAPSQIEAKSKHLEVSPTMECELDRFFPRTMVKQAFRESSLAVKRGLGDKDSTLTATDILAAIPSIHTRELPPAAIGCGLADDSSKPISHLRTMRRRLRDYAADEPLRRLRGEGRGSAGDRDDADSWCTPPAYWEIDFPHSR
ncbi:hypothetical protein ERJ75_000245500 [Trypanosoma vivax]|uniref:Uncharacterized protein n=1 Tax=Trypanosoma vivax (strain Y486) TaxID=1055687 RepID=G0U1R6_TRYVY|nr:hypothetical protein TRVL_06893 [Trypanosoma vivax]KAH8618835.1 hypothetical protein ERJ75_000245500 [Trypanosoma vivax]CCC50215.1 conserved hypothetical protein [Trypanosoma vivax Y486]